MALYVDSSYQSILSYCRYYNGGWSNESQDLTDTPGDDNDEHDDNGVYSNENNNTPGVRKTRFK